MRPEEDDSGGTPGPGWSGSPEEDGEWARLASVVAEEAYEAPLEELPARLCATAVRLLPVCGASVLLRGDGLPVRLGASDGTAARVADVQGTLGEGPGLDAAAAGAPVFACDLARGADLGRWPVFAEQATGAGVRAVYSLPLGEGAACVGSLDLYRDTPGEPTGRDLRTGGLVAGVVTVALMALPDEEWTVFGGGDSRLGRMTSEHEQIHQATGMIMAQLDLGAGDALARLRGYAFAHGRTAGAAAREVIAHRKRFDDE
ncbi:GAF and ANTAR domain-containing protein [Streptomyces sp. NPDC059785]|uniref:GAF and ANTAR domain-containing protein n=1 Tax=Streptomyces sp. NPDC059785 TaxID=3346945 RepID=UPI00364A95AB